MACIAPIPIRLKETTTWTGTVFSQIAHVPCSKCSECRKRNINDWVFRLYQEQQVSSSSLFLTLTYDDSTLTRSSSGLPTLNHADYQKFMKRLRKRIFGNAKSNLKYFMVGEYGSETKRPHYHAIMFNATADDVQATWQNGFVHHGTVTTKSMAYCMKYIDKDCDIGKNPWDDRKPAYRKMSKHLGIAYLNDANVRWHKEDITRTWVYSPDMKSKYALPRYYAQKIFTPMERSCQAEWAMQQREGRRHEAYRLYTEEYYHINMQNGLDHWEQFCAYEAAGLRAKQDRYVKKESTKTREPAFVSHA